MLSNTLANIPATALTGTLFIATDTFALYRYDGSTWQLIGGPGTGTITGSGTANQVAYFTASGVIASSNNLQFNGTTLTAANDIVVNGVTVGNGNGSAASNYVFGTESLRSFTTGNSLIAIGSNCFDTTVQGVEGIAIGYNVMREANVFSNNIGIGFNVMRFANNNGNNIGIGSDVLMGGSMTGFLNVAVGMYSMWRNTSGFQNTAYGHDSLQENTTGAYNVAIGDYAVSSNTTGESNVGLGRRAIQTVTTGSGNIGIGQFAGGQLTTEGPVTGSNNIFIGTNAKTIANNHDNEIVIGYNAIGAGSNTITLGNTSIVNTYLRGTVNANHIAVTKNNSGIAVNITDSANGNAINVNKTGSGFAINVDAGLSNFINANFAGTIRTTNATVITGGGSGVEIRYLSGNGEIFTYDRANNSYLPTYIDGSILSLNTFGGNILLGTVVDNLTDKLQVLGSAYFSNRIIANAGFVSFTADGLFNANALPILINLPGGSQDLRFGYWSDGGGNYYPRIGFKGGTNWAIGLRTSGGNDFVINVGNGGSTTSGITITPTGAFIVTDYIQTANPTSGTAQPWKLGSYVAVAAPAPTGYIEIDINGTLYKVAAGT